MALDPSLERLGLAIHHVKVLADVVLLVHFGIVLFIVGGLALVVAGNLGHWRWVNKLWFRLAHLAAIGVVVLQSWLGQLCPLTYLESWLRWKAGSPTYSKSFIEHWVHRVLFYEAPFWVFALTYTVFGLLVVIVWWRFPPHPPMAWPAWRWLSIIRRAGQTAGGPHSAMHPQTPAPSRIASCSCGQLRAQVSGESVRISVCHCLACQRRTGSVFGAQARFAREAVTVAGTSAEYVRVGDEGIKATFRFCPKCGATVYYTLEGMAGAVAIPVGAFADPSFPAPSFSAYEERMHSWVSMPGGMERMA